MYINEGKTKSIFPGRLSNQKISIIAKKKLMEDIVYRISKLRKERAENRENIF
jgi:hypothetical protein